MMISISRIETPYRYQRNGKWRTYYPGAKSAPGVGPRLINLMPPHEVYIEPFLGSGAVMRMKKPAPLNIGIDIDAKVNMPIPPAESALTPAGSTHGLAADPRRRRTADSPRVHQPRFHLVHGDGINFLACYPFTGAELVYCDPPYLLSERTGGRRYRCEMSDVDHRRFLSVAIALPCPVLISGYWSAIYASALKGWNSVHYRQIQHTGEFRTEWIWYNYPAPDELHDYRFLGRNFRERQDFRRMIRSWTGKLIRMPRLKRRALLEAILEATAEEPRSDRTKADTPLEASGLRDVPQPDFVDGLLPRRQRQTPHERRRAEVAGLRELDDHPARSAPSELGD
jgi:hypothetical protein